LRVSNTIMVKRREYGNAICTDRLWAETSRAPILLSAPLVQRTAMYPTDDEGTARAQAQYDRTNQLVLGMAATFHDLWLYAENRAAVKVTDGSTFAVSEITEARRDPFDQIWLTFALLDADEGDLGSFEQLSGAAGTVVTRSRALGSITLRYDQIVAVLIDENEPSEDED
jgi:hypothetical protein